VVVSPAMVWKSLASRIGKTVPAPAKDLPRLKRRLLRAGFRGPSAARLFQGVRAGIAAGFGLAALAIVWKVGTNVLLCPALAMLGYMAPGHWLMWRMARRP